MVEEIFTPIVKDLSEASKEKIKRTSEARKAVLNGMTEKKWSFNPLNGEVKTYDTKEDFDMDMTRGGFVPIDRPPAKNCKTCYGRGYVGKDIIHNYFAPCGCMFDTKKKGKLNV